MSDEHSPNGRPRPFEIEVESSEPEAAKPRRRGRAKAAAPQPPPPAPSPAPPATEPPAVEIPIGGAASPPAPANFWGEAIGEPAPAPANFWGETIGEPTPDPATTSVAGGAADSLYEVELEVRNTAQRSEGRAADMGAMAAGALQLVGENLRRMSEQQAERVNELLRGIDLKDYLDPAFWQGIGMVLKYQVDETVGAIKRRASGEYTTDAFGMDREAIEMVRPFLRFMYRTWWRVSVEGLEHVPAEGRALLVANHSGVLPWDGAMIATAVADDHPTQTDRIVRSLHLHWFSTLPFIAPALAAMGQVPGLPENAVRLLENDELVAVFPEGLKGVGKLYKDRYKLARFGRGGFVQVALRARAPIVPVAVVGAEEIYPMLANAEPVAKLFGMPYFPLTPFFPWLGPLGVIPIPTRWSITFCEPLRTDEYDPAAAEDPLTVLGLTEMVRERIQTTIDAKLAERKSVF
jgi:1-acyl-sn-glycerol-3-phosphate acyltransferase